MVLIGAYWEVFSKAMLEKNIGKKGCKELFSSGGIKCVIALVTTVHPQCLGQILPTEIFSAVGMDIILSNIIHC